MGSSNTWAIDHESAHRFLALLGKDPTTTRLRAFPHRDDPRRQQIGARKGVWNLRQAERWARAGRGVYVVINDGGDRNSAIQSCRALFVEWDDQPIAWQGQAWRELGLPEPTVIVSSGGRSLHCYWVLREPLAPAAWRPLQRELIEKAQGDRSCCDLARVMRLPGSWYLDAQGQPLARASIEAASGQRYGADELAAALLACRGLGEEVAGFLPARHGRGQRQLETAPAPEAAPHALDAPLGPRLLLPPAKHPTAPTDMTSPATPAPTWSDICSALAAIPPRVAGTNTYGVYRNILWGLISATEEAGHQKEEAIALMEAHSPSGESGWDVRQVASSGGEQIGAATFWFHARRCGWRPEGEQGTRRPPSRHRPQVSHSPAGVAGAAGPTTGTSGPRPGPKTLPLKRRLDALEHCIRALLGREANSIRRQAQVRRAQDALELRALLRHQEIGQLILEAHDRRHGNRFQGLDSPQRLSMSVPQLEWEIPGCLPARDLTILGGRAKVGKTRLAHALLRSLLCAEDFLGFGAPSRPRPVILISDDQADGDTAQMLLASGMWGHPLLIWSRRFRATESNLEALRECLREQGPASQGGAVVMLDSLRSITRSCCFGENDPEMGTLIYDLKHQITEAGGTVLLVHHCNKANETTGTEALSGHNAIAGAANTILTLHYLSEGNRLLKESPQRRLVREARSGPPVDLVVAMEEECGRFVRIGSYSDVLAEQEAQRAAQEDQEKALDRLQKATNEQEQALRHLLERHQRGEQGLPVLQLLQAVGAVPETAQRRRDLVGEDLTRYTTLARLLTHLTGIVVSTRKPEEGGGYCLRYSLSTAGAKWLAEALDR
jgi:hypothetical protein